MFISTVGCRSSGKGILNDGMFIYHDASNESPQLYLPRQGEDEPIVWFDQRNLTNITESIIALDYPFSV